MDTENKTPRITVARLAECINSDFETSPVLVFIISLTKTDRRTLPNCIAEPMTSSRALWVLS